MKCWAGKLARTLAPGGSGKPGQEKCHALALTVAPPKGAGEAVHGGDATLAAIYHEVAQGVLEEAVGYFGLPHAARPWHREAACTAGVCHAAYPGTRRKPLLPISLQFPLLTKLTIVSAGKGEIYRVQLPDDREDHEGRFGAVRQQVDNGNVYLKSVFNNLIYRPLCHAGLAGKAILKSVCRKCTVY